jgi:hypothetical protein
MEWDEVEGGMKLMEWDKVDRLLIAPELSLCQFQFQAVKQKEETDRRKVHLLVVTTKRCPRFCSCFCPCVSAGL